MITKLLRARRLEDQRVDAFVRAMHRSRHCVDACCTPRTDTAALPRIVQLAGVPLGLLIAAGAVLGLSAPASTVPDVPTTAVQYEQPATSCGDYCGTDAGLVP
jgi:hypothetical protein